MMTSATVADRKLEPQRTIHTRKIHRLSTPKSQVSINSSSKMLQAPLGFAKEARSKIAHGTILVFKTDSLQS